MKTLLAILALLAPAVVVVLVYGSAAVPYLAIGYGALTVCAAAVEAFFACREWKRRGEKN